MLSRGCPSSRRSRGRFHSARPAAPRPRRLDGHLGELVAIVDGTAAEGRSQVAGLVAAVVEAGGTSEEALVEMLRDPGRPLALRVDICWLIPRLALPAAADILEPMLSVAEDKLREEVAVGLGLIGQDTSVDALCNTVQQDAARPVRQAALHALGLFDAPRATAVLLDVLGGAREDEDVRADAAEALAIRAPKASSIGCSVV
jgi:HEAT repeat protein